MEHNLARSKAVHRSKPKLGAVITGVLIATISTAVGATTYNGGQAFAGFNFDGSYASELVDFSFTTDGSVGPLASSDIAAFLLSGSGGLGAFSIDSSNGGTYSSFADTGFSATAAELSFNFNDPNAGGIFASSTQEILFFPGSEAVGPLFNPESGDVVIASATSAAPEPSIWLLMMAGLAIVGGALRLGRKRGLGLPSIV